MNSLFKSLAMKPFGRISDIFFSCNSLLSSNEFPLKKNQPLTPYVKVQYLTAFLPVLVGVRPEIQPGSVQAP